MPSIVQQLCDAHKKKLDLNLNNQEQTEAWKPPVVETDPITNQPLVIRPGTWLEEDGSPVQDPFSYDAIDTRGAEYSEPPFVHDPANWETITLPNGNTNHQPLGPNDPRRRSFSNPSGGAWVALSSRQCMHLRSFAGHVLWVRNRGMWNGTEFDEQGDGITQEDIREFMVLGTRDPISKEVLRFPGTLLRDLTLALQNCVDPVPYLADGAELPEDGPMPNVHQIGVEDSPAFEALRDRAAYDAGREQRLQEMDRQVQAALQAAQEAADNDPANALSMEDLYTIPMGGTGLDAILFNRRPSILPLFGNASEIPLTLAGVASADLSLIDRSLDSAAVRETRMLQLRWRPYPERVRQEWIALPERMRSSDEPRVRNSAEQYVRTLRQMFQAYRMTQDQIRYADSVGSQDNATIGGREVSYASYVRACFDNVRQKERAMHTKESTFFKDVFLQIDHMIRMHNRKQEVEFERLMATRKVEAKKQAKIAGRSLVSRLNACETADQMRRVMTEVANNVQEAIDAAMQSGVEVGGPIDVNNVRRVGTNLMSGAWDNSMEWNPVTKEQMEEWLQRVSDIEQRLNTSVSKRTLGSANDKKIKTRLRRWFMSSADYVDLFPTGKKISRKNNSASWIAKVQTATAERDRVANGNVLAINNYKTKTLNRALQKLNDEVIKVNEAERQIFRVLSPGERFNLPSASTTRFFTHTLRLERLLEQNYRPAQPANIFEIDGPNPDDNPAPVPAPARRSRRPVIDDDFDDEEEEEEEAPPGSRSPGYSPGSPSGLYPVSPDYSPTSPQSGPNPPPD